jgi:hypothetical protein
VRTAVNGGSKLLMPRSAPVQVTVVGAERERPGDISVALEAEPD